MLALWVSPARLLWSRTIKVCAEFKTKSNQDIGGGRKEATLSRANPRFRSGKKPSTCSFIARHSEAFVPRRGTCTTASTLYPLTIHAASGTRSLSAWPAILSPFVLIIAQRYASEMHLSWCNCIWKRENCILFSRTERCIVLTLNLGRDLPASTRGQVI